MKSDSKTWLAVILCCGVWFAYMKWFAPVPPPVSETPAPITQSGATSQQETVSNKGTPAATPTSSREVGDGMFPRVEWQESYTWENPQLQVAFSDAGGKPSRVAVRAFHETLKDESPLVAPVGPRETPYSLSALFTAPELRSFGSGRYEESVSGDQVKFTRSEGGVTVEKTFLMGDGHYFDHTIRVTFPEGGRQDWGTLVMPLGAAPGLEYDMNVPLKSWETVLYQNEEIEREALEPLEQGDEEESETYRGTTSWLAFGNRYFASALINKSTLNPDVVFAKKHKFNGGYLQFPLVRKSGQNEVTLQFRVFVGPKEIPLLKSTPGMTELLDYGMFSWLAHPLLGLLRFFYKYVQNYGVAIILLTLLVRAIFYPLSAKSAKSMKAMQKLQPQIKELKEKYKEDMQRFNQEQMALFKTHKVNPMGGCLPMLVQLPVFIALYSVLMNSIELFHAPFFFWIQDLSTKDPFYVFPVLMGLSMAVQQRMTPSPGMDPMQQKMMMLMPIVFTFIMLNLPSGLTIYIFLSTILGIAQQLLVNKDKEPAAALSTQPNGG